MYEYYLKFTNPKTNTSVTQTTTEFVKDNKSYIDDKKINLMKTAEEQGFVIDAFSGKTNSINSLNSDRKLSKTPDKNATSNKAVSPINFQLIIIVLILILLFVIAIGIFFYIKKNSAPKF